MRAAFQSTISPMKTPWVRVVALTLAISVSFRKVGQLLGEAEVVAWEAWEVSARWDPGPA
jgi:hypothetical protein